jgi:hypothetical protein
MNRILVRALSLVFFVAFATSCGDDDTTPKDAGADSGADAGKAVCGNGKVEGSELCDGTDLNHETCSTIGDGLYTGGVLNCSKKCTFVLTMCTGNDSGANDMDSGGGGTGGT